MSKKSHRFKNVETRTRKSVSMKRVKELMKEEIKQQTLAIPEGFSLITLDKGYCFISLDKKLKNQEFFKTAKFNAHLRRRSFEHIKPEQFGRLVEGYFSFRSMFNTKKAMKKHIKKIKMQEFNRKQLILKRQTGVTSEQ